MNTYAVWQRILKRLLTFPYLLMLLTLIYVGAYLMFSFTPGVNPLYSPLGWWGWVDQGFYLKAANAFYALNFSADQYFYPPLYSALGSIFLIGSSDHPFFLVNLLCFLWFTYVFIRFCDLYFSRAVGVFLLFASTICAILIFENFVIPWTSTLSAALLATGIVGLIWVDEVKRGKRRDVRNWQAFIVGLSLGLMVPTRPADALIGMVIGCAFIWSYWTLPKTADTQKHMLRFLISAGSGAIVGPALFIGFNLGVHGALLGNYLQVAGSHGFFMADLPEKFFSIWLHAEPLYGEPGASLVEQYPWLLLSLAGLVWIALRGDFLLRTMALAITAFFVLYLPYGDLLPSGLWRFLNVHYFKWTFPFFALFACILVAQVMRGLQGKVSWILSTGILVLVPLLLVSLQMKMTTEPLVPRHESGSSLAFELPHHPIDFIDVKGVTGNFDLIYFGDHGLTLDGHALKINRDFRLLDHGADMRILFIRPMEGRTLILHLDPRLQLHAQQLNAQSGSYRFSLGLPSFTANASASPVPAAYRLNQALDFSNQGPSLFYIREGFSIAESQGRWTLNAQALIDLRVMNLSPEKNAQLELTFKALLSPLHECQQVTIRLNQQQIGNTRLCMRDQGDRAQDYVYTIPAGTIGKGGLVQVQIATPDSVSPRQLKMNTDERKLGIFIQSLKITQ